jgi:hypothetical protein
LTQFASPRFSGQAPQLALQRTFGAELEGPLADVVVRSWGILVTLIGAMTAMPVIALDGLMVLTFGLLLLKASHSSK